MATPTFMGPDVTVTSIPTTSAVISAESGKHEKENTGRWTHEEHELFIKGLRLHNKQWKLIAELIQTRTIVQIRTHAQKYFQKLMKLKGESSLSNDLEGLTKDVAMEGPSIKMKKKPPQEPMMETQQVAKSDKPVMQSLAPKPAPVTLKVERQGSPGIRTDTESDAQAKAKHPALQSSRSTMHIPSVGLEEQMMLCVKPKTPMKPKALKAKPETPVRKKISAASTPRKQVSLDEGATSASECSTPVPYTIKEQSNLKSAGSKVEPVEMDVDMSLLGLDMIDWGMTSGDKGATQRGSPHKKIALEAVGKAISTQVLEPFNSEAADHKALSREASLSTPRQPPIPEPLVIPDTSSFNLDMDWIGMDAFEQITDLRISPKASHQSQWEPKIERTDSLASACTSRSDLTSLAENSPTSSSSSNSNSSSSSSSDDEIDDMDFNMMTSIFFDDDLTSSLLDDDMSMYMSASDPSSAPSAVVGEGTKKISPMLKNCTVKPPSKLLSSNEEKAQKAEKSSRYGTRKRGREEITDPLMDSNLLDNFFDSYEHVL